MSDAEGDLVDTNAQQKRAAGYAAADLVATGMVVGLGSGSTARFATLRIGERLRSGELRDIVGIPTSEETARLAAERGIPLSDLDRHPRIDLTIDGADEVDPRLRLIKGHGGYLLREKIVAAASARLIIVVDASKLVERLGIRFAVPVEIIRFGWRNAAERLARTGAVTELRESAGQPYVTDEGNYIVDCHYRGGIDDPASLSCDLNTIPGVVENGLFLDLVVMVIVASGGGIQRLER